MAKRSDDQYGTYRCPVCGHRDGAQLRGGLTSALVSCTYCETSLEVSVRGPGSVYFSAQVAREPATR